MKKSVVNVNTSSFSYFPTNMFNAEHVIGHIKQFNILSQICGYTSANFLNMFLR